MIKNITSIEIVKSDRKYVLMLDPESPLGECFDAVNEIRACIIEKINLAAQQAEQEKVTQGE